MFVDACAIVSLLSLEETAERYGSCLDGADDAWTSPMAAFEAILVLARPEKLDLSYEAVEAIVVEFLDARDIEVREPGSPRQLLSNAVRAAARYGVGRRKLSTFDCLHYAAAKVAGCRLLTMDELLRETDVATAP
ncbi:type II toxin-antitoxin system VapC family toxin [Methylopila sp. M107]|uniref:type II toxin-antitoxin system VapC family toxin n=1 Tax=Methylopila sp. M107 TaxID=1101190 RepID=UPI0003822F88|nr:type II toxin-antitoxin system VapC family toxin [Methylopila sp. M107]